MLSFCPSYRHFLYGESVDMRKGFDVLSDLIRNHLDRDLLSGEVYIFLNLSLSLIKLLHRETGRLALYYIRLEKERFSLLVPILREAPLPGRSRC